MQTMVEIEGLDRLQAALREAPKIAEPILQKAVEAGIFEVQKKATKGNIPWKTGFLTQSFGLGVIIGRLVAMVHPTAGYAIFVHEGTAPHVILPKNGKALFWKGAAHPVRSVNHPGTKPNRFMPRIAAQAKDAVTRHFVAAIEKITDAIANKAK
jgi:hypothetical protein